MAEVSPTASASGANTNSIPSAGTTQGSTQGASGDASLTQVNPTLGLIQAQAMSTLSEEGKAIFSAITCYIETKFSTIPQISNQMNGVSIKLDLVSNQFDQLTSKLEAFEESLAETRKQMLKLENNQNLLERKFNQLLAKFDDLENYTRRETIVISGKCIPNEEPNENTTNIAVRLLQSKINVNIDSSEISVSHRIGKFIPGASNARPIILKLLHRSTKYMLMDACIKNRASKNLSDFHLNESLSSLRMTLYSDLKQIRWKHKSLFQQLYTRDGVIFVKLTVNQKQKYMIKTEDQLLSFLNNYPQLKDTYDEMKAILTLQ